MASQNFVFIGNPGSGKSATINCLVGEHLFKSGFSTNGIGVTYKLDVKVRNGVRYMDTPGLSHIQLRTQAGLAIEDALRQGGKFRVIFMVLLDANRIRVEDLLMIKVVMEAANQIPSDGYAIMCNKCKKKAMSRIDMAEWMKNLKEELEERGVQTTKYVHFAYEIEELDAEDDVVIRLPSDTQSFIQETVPELNLDPAVVKEVNTDFWETMHESLAEQRAAKDAAEKARKAAEENEAKAQQERNNETKRRLEIEAQRLRDEQQDAMDLHRLEHEKEHALDEERRKTEDERRQRAISEEKQKADAESKPLMEKTQAEFDQQRARETQRQQELDVVAAQAAKHAEVRVQQAQQEKDKQVGDERRKHQAEKKRQEEERQQQVAAVEAFVEEEEEEEEEEADKAKDAEFGRSAKEYQIQRFSEVFEAQYDSATDETNFPVHHKMAELINLKEHCKLLKLLPFAVDVRISNAREDVITKIQNQVYTDRPESSNGPGLIEQSNVTVETLRDQMKAAKITEANAHNNRNDAAAQLQEALKDLETTGEIFDIMLETAVSEHGGQHDPLASWNQKCIAKITDMIAYSQHVLMKSSLEEWNDTESKLALIKEQKFSSYCPKLAEAWRDRFVFEKLTYDNCASSNPPTLSSLTEALDSVHQELLSLQVKKNECEDAIDDLRIQRAEKSEQVLDEIGKNSINRKLRVKEAQLAMWQWGIKQCRSALERIEDQLHDYSTTGGRVAQGVVEKTLRTVWKGLHEERNFQVFRKCWNIESQLIFLEFEGGYEHPKNAVLENMVEAFELNTWYLDDVKPGDFWSAQGARYVVDHIVFVRKLMYYKTHTSETKGEVSELSNSEQTYYDGLCVKFLLLKPLLPAPRGFRCDGCDSSFA